MTVSNTSRARLSGILICPHYLQIVVVKSAVPGTATSLYQHVKAVLGLNSVQLISA